MHKRLFDVDGWKVKTNKLHHEDIRLQESLTSIGNGYMGMRGNFEEKYSGNSHNGTYIAGVWFPDKTRVGWWKIGYPEYFGKVINAINLIGIRVIIEGKELDLAACNVVEFYHELNMQNGLLVRNFIVEQEGKKTKIEAERFLSLNIKELCAIEYKVTPLNYTADIELIPYLDGNVHNEDSNYDETFWDEVGTGEGYVISKTKENPFEVPRFTVCALMDIETIGETTKETVVKQSMYTEKSCKFTAQQGETVGVRKYVVVTTSRDYEENQLLTVAKEIKDKVRLKTYSELANKHSELWLERWDKADVKIEGDEEAQQGIRFNLYQLFSTYYGEDKRLNIGPKGFTGEKYGGATYWDTEAYAVPMYLSVANPQVTKNLLLYRHEQLDAAYHNAKMQGLKGALYPMVTFTGVECHNEWEITFEEIHRNAAMVHAIYNYVNYTGDRDYLGEYGIDVLVSICRFWADRVHFSKRKGVYMLHGVTGPNEYENNVNNNFYTNYMAKWNLEYTVEVIQELQEKKDTKNLEKWDVSEDEISNWRQIAENMYLPYDEELGVYVQHDTFLDKDLRVVDTLSKEDRPLNQNWSWDKILRSCFIKQADVLQAMYFLNNEFTKEEKKRNFSFYEPMTVHESSLSPCIHSILAAELKMEEKAVEMYKRTARLDLDNYNNDTEDGLHTTSMTGSWLSIVHGFAGMRTYNETLSFSPFLPKDWDGYSFKINYRGRLLEVKVDKEKVTLLLLQGEDLTIQVFEKDITLTKDPIELPLV